MNGGGVKLTLFPQKKLPSKGPALLGLTSSSLPQHEKIRYLVTFMGINLGSEIDNVQNQSSGSFL